MEQPSPPTSLPKYLAEGLPKQDTETLHEIQNYVEALIEYRDQSLDADELPKTAEPIDERWLAVSGGIGRQVADLRGRPDAPREPSTQLVESY